MNIENNKTYRIKGNSEYFKKKYGTSNPIIIIEGKDWEVFGKSWGMMIDNPACLLYAVRSPGIPIGGQVYYGKINGLGECVHETELEALTEAELKAIEEKN